MKVLLLSLVFLVLLPTSGPATVEFPSPKGAVNDFAQIIDDRQEEELENFLRDFWRKYRVALVVVTLPEVGSEPVEEVAARLFDTWAIGGSEGGMGVLLLMTQREGEAWVQVGYHLRRVLGEGKAMAILTRYVIPKMREGDAGTGAILGVLAIAREIAKGEKGPSPPKASPSSLGFLVVILLVLVMAMLVLPQVLRRGRLP